MSNSNQIESGNEVSARTNALKAEAKEIMPVSIFAQGLFNLFNPSEEFIQDDTFEAEAKKQAKAEAKEKAEAEEQAKAEAEEQAKAEEKAKAEAEEQAKADAQWLFNLFNPSEEFIQDDTFKAEAKEQAEAEAEEQAKAEVEEQAKTEAEEQAKAEAKEQRKAELLHETEIMSKRDKSLKIFIYSQVSIKRASSLNITEYF